MKSSVLEDKCGLVYNGGGVLGIGHLGVRSRLETKCDMQQFTHFAGASSGGIIATMDSIRAPFQYMYDQIFSVNMKDFLDETANDFDIVDAARFWARYGWYKGDKLSEWYRELIGHVSGDPHLTMADAALKYKTYLILTTYCINTNKTMYLTPELFPNLPLWRALRWTSSFPFVYAADQVTPSELEEFTNGQIESTVNVMFSDGGLLDNYPIAMVERHVGADKTIGSKLIWSETDWKPPKKINTASSNPVSYAVDMAKAFRLQGLKTHVPEASWARTIKVDPGELSAIDFDITDSQKTWLFKSGQQCFDQFFNE